MRSRRVGAAAVAVALVSFVTLGPRAAEANGPDAGTITTSYVVPTLAALLAGGATTLFFNFATAAPPSQKRKFLSRHATDLKRELTLGAGPTLDRLARTFGVAPERHDDFGRLLASKRDELVPLTNRRKLDTGRAERFFAIVENLVSNHPELGRRRTVRRGGHFRSTR